MDKLIMVRSIVLLIGWPVLIAGSLYLFFKGRHVYSLVKGSLVGKIIQSLVYTMLVGMYSLGIVSTAYMYSSVDSVLIIMPIFVIWFVMFILSLKVLINAEKEAGIITGGKSA